GPHSARRAHARRSRGRIAGRQFEPGRRHQGHLGARRIGRMLARTADNLYWLSRYVERAEYLARILEATHRVATLPVGYAGSTNEWESALSTAGCATAFFAVYNDPNEENVTEFLAFSTANPSSIRPCFEIPRPNAPAVRTALT